MKQENITPAEQRVMAANCFAFPRSMTPRIEAMAGQLMTAMCRAEGHRGGVPKSVYKAAIDVKADRRLQRGRETMAAILRAIASEPLSRMQVAEATGLGAIYISDRTKVLVAEGLMAKGRRVGPVQLPEITDAGRVWLAQVGAAA